MGVGVKKTRKVRSFTDFGILCDKFIRSMLIRIQPYVQYDLVNLGGSLHLK